MPEYDEFAETYQNWSVTASDYSRVEIHSFLEVLGPVRGLRVLDLAAGEGRASRLLMERGAATVLGAEVSPEMVRRATEQNTPGSESAGAKTWPGLRYVVLDATDPDFRLDPPVDLVTAMYLFHYAPTEADLAAMARLIARNLEPGGRFVTYTISPDFEFDKLDPRLKERCGFTYRVVEGNHCTLVIGDQEVDIWQWSRALHEDCLHSAGLVDVTWHPLRAPPGAPEVEARLDFYLANPSCIVLEAKKPA